MGNTVGNQKSLTKIQKCVLVGTLLGDGVMELNGRYPRLRIDHSERQAPYVKWKYNIFQNLITGGIKKFSQKADYRTKKKYKHCKFDTISTPVFNEIYKEFYRDKRKIVPDDIKELLKNSLSLAVWYMDDGYRRLDCNALRISTNCYSRKEIKLLQEALMINFGINSKQHMQSNNQYVIYIPSVNAKKFCNIIRPFVIKFFHYKLI